MPNASFWENRRVLVTGHTGFKGSWLTLWLLQLGAQVTGYALPPEETPNLFDALALTQADTPPGRGILHHHLGDIRDASSLQQVVEQTQPEVVVHLAAQPLVRQSYRDPVGTWTTNVLGSLQLLEALKSLEHACAVVMVTTDKVYENREWDYGYRETDRLGGRDPYSASKAAAELAIASWRDSFCGSALHQTPRLRIATARAGNVIGGGDWASDRMVPDAIRALAEDKAIGIRNPEAVRPWQHVLEPLEGYLRLAEALATDPAPPCDAFNFGPPLSSSRTVRELIEEILRYWPGCWQNRSEPTAPHEARLLHLQIDKAQRRLGWQPRWDFATTISRTVAWYRAQHRGTPALDNCLDDLATYTALLTST